MKEYYVKRIKDKSVKKNSLYNDDSNIFLFDEIWNKN